MRLAFMGTPDFSVPFLQKLHAAGHEIVAVYTQPPRKGGRRGLKEIPSPVQQAAESLGLKVFSPKSLRNAEEQEKFAALKLDAAIVVAYGLILPEEILNAPKLGCYNGHASLLPRWRGAAPIQRAIEAGDTETGVVIMQMDQGLDTGAILSQKDQNGQQKPFVYKMPIEQDTTTGMAFDQLSQKGAELMVDAVAALENNNYCLEPQPAEGANYARKIDKSETRINWQKPALNIHKHICSLSPFPGGWTEMHIGDNYERVKILSSHLPTPQDWENAYQEGITLLDGHGNRPAKILKSVSGELSQKDTAYLAILCGDASNSPESLAQHKQENIIFLKTLQKAGGKAITGQEFLRGRAITAIK